MQTGRDPAKTLVGDDLAALFGLDMADSEPPDILATADVPSANQRLTTRTKTVTKRAATTTASTPKADATPRPQKPNAAFRRACTEREGHRCEFTQGSTCSSRRPSA